MVYAYPLGASYREVKACGPRPSADDGPEVWVEFFPGAWQQIEWQCPELSKRFMYLAYDIAPYSAHGKDVVWNCDPDANGCWLEQVANPTPGRAPQPGDVLSYGPTSTYGHTSVVAESNVDGDGNGTILVIEQNASSDGDSTLAVNDWEVASYSMAVSGWLHDPGIPPDGVALVGPATGRIQAAQRFTATVSPPDSLLPLTYDWRATGRAPIVNTVGLSDTVPFAWDAGGAKVITLTARNGAGAVTVTHAISIDVTAWETYSVHLPLVAVGPCGQRITNGGFEADGDWETPSTPYPAAFTTAVTRSGSRLMRAGIDNPGDNRYSYSSARQLVAIPADAVSATLRLWLYPMSEEPPMSLALQSQPPALSAGADSLAMTGDVQYVLILDENYQWLETLLWQRSDDRVWTFHQFDLTSYAGQSINVHFGAYNDGSDGVTAMYVDDVSLELCGAAAAPP